MALDIANTIRIIRQARGERIGVVAKNAGISAPFLTLIEQGKREPSLKVLRDIAEALDVPAEALLLASQPEDSSITTSNKAAKTLIASVDELAKAELRLRKSFGKAGIKGED